MPITNLTYEQLIAAQSNKGAFFAALPNQISTLWQEDYLRSFRKAEFLEVSTAAGGASFTYLFDHKRSRAVGPWGEPIYSAHARDADHMRGAPLGAPLRAKTGSGYHRGHLIAHSIGDGMDINLVPQLGKVNIGPFRVLERLARDLAQKGVRAFYFVRNMYNDDNDLMPFQIEQGLISGTDFFDYALHKNQ